MGLLRYDKTLTLIQETAGEYSPTAGGRTAETTTELEVTGNVSDMDREAQEFLYGKSTQDTIIARINGTIKDPQQYLIHDEKKYTITRQKTYRHKTVFWAVLR